MTTPYKLVPSKLHEVWDDIRPGLEEIKQRWPELSTWRVEDVYAAIKYEDAVVYVTEDGFAVCTILPDAYTKKADLFIWIAYAYEPKRGGMLQKYLDSFVEVAREMGCEGVCTESSHPALEGFDAMYRVYSHYRVPVNV